jgi:hypothetical protein
VKKKRCKKEGGVRRVGSKEGINGLRRVTSMIYQIKCSTSMLSCILYLILIQPPPCVVHRPIYHSITPISPINLIASVNSPHEIPIPFPVPFSRFTLLNTDRRYTLSDNMSNTAWRLRRWFRPVCVCVRVWEGGGRTDRK